MIYSVKCIQNDDSSHWLIWYWQNQINQKYVQVIILMFCFSSHFRWRSGLLIFILKGILPRELVSDGVLENSIPSSTIWNRCSWAGTDFRISDSVDHSLQRYLYQLFQVYDAFSQLSRCSPPVLHRFSTGSPCGSTLFHWSPENSVRVRSSDHRKPPPLSPRLTVFLWCFEFPSCLAPLEIGYNAEGISTQTFTSAAAQWSSFKYQKMAALSCRTRPRLLSQVGRPWMMTLVTCKWKMLRGQSEIYVKLTSFHSVSSIKLTSCPLVHWFRVWLLLFDSFFIEVTIKWK